MIRNDSKAEVFENLVYSERGNVIGWLKKKYERMLITECEDVFQEASMVLWDKFKAEKGWNGDSLKKMLYRICRNVSTHHLAKLPFFEEWEPTSQQEEEQVETDFGFVTPDVYHAMQKEQLYSLIDQLDPSDREFMKLCLAHKRLRDIVKLRGYSSYQAVKNRKSKIVARLRKETGGQAIYTCPLFLSPYPNIVSYK